MIAGNALSNGIRGTSQHGDSLKAVADKTGEESGRPKPERTAYESQRITELVLSEAKSGSENIRQRLEGVQHSDARIEIRRQGQDGHKEGGTDGNRNAKLAGGRHTSYYASDSRRLATYESKRVLGATTRRTASVAGR